MTKGKNKKAILDAYRDAYMAANATEPSIVEKAGGWFVINEGASKWRLSSLIQMTEELRQRTQREK